jgi:hypothetical protein
MIRKSSLMAVVLALSLLVAIPVAFADQPANVGGGLGNKAPNFSAGVYGDGQAWGTKGTTSLPAPTDQNSQSYDKIVTITNGADGQLPVAEAAPGNPLYNGGRWTSQSATWAENLPFPPPLLTSYDQVMYYVNLGLLTITDDGVYFQCPLLPVK